MNFLSILIYGADVLSKLGPFLIVSAFIISVLCLVFIFVSAISISDTESFSYGKDPKEVENKKQGLRSIRNKATKFLVVPFILVFLSVFVPSANTVYLVAGSELAEAGYKTELGQKLTTVVNEKIESYMETLTVENLKDKIDISGLTQEEKNALIKRLSDGAN